VEVFDDEDTTVPVNAENVKSGFGTCVRGKFSYAVNDLTHQ